MDMDGKVDTYQKLKVCKCIIHSFIHISSEEEISFHPNKFPMKRPCWFASVLAALLLNAVSGVVDLGSEVDRADLGRGGGLRSWAERSKAYEDVQGDELQRGVLFVFTGNEQAHWDELHGFLTLANPRCFRDSGESVLKVSGENSSDEEVVRRRIADFLRKRQFNERLPKSVIFIESAEEMPVRVLNGILSTFARQSKCTDPVERLLIRDCDELAIIMSTSFAKSEARAHMDFLIEELPEGMKEMERDSKLRMLERSSERMVRQLLQQLPNGLGFQKIKQRGTVRLSVIPIIGNPKPVDFERLVGLQDRIRASVESNKTPLQCTNGLDLAVFERMGYVGQRFVLEDIKTALINRARGLKMSNGPLVFLLAGPAGVGKSFLSELIAMAINCGKSLEELQRRGSYRFIDMGSLPSKDDADALVGTRPGIKGSGSFPDTFEKSQRPVIVLDEIEKAHSDFLRKTLLPVFDGHFWSKKDDKTYRTTEAIFVLTTNCQDGAIQTLASRIKIKEMKRPQYEDLLAEISKMMKIPQTVCGDTQDGVSNPFASEPLWRRLIDCNSLANTFGMHVLLPPSEDDVSQLIRLRLDARNRKWRQSLYYSPRALQLIEMELKTRQKQGYFDLSKVDAELSSILLTAIPDHVFESREEKIILYEGPGTGKLAVAMVADGVNLKQECGKQEVENRKIESETNSEEDHKEKGEIIELEILYEHEPEKIVDDSREHEFQEAIQALAVTIAVYFLSVNIALPLFKAVFVGVALVAAVLYLVSPELFWFVASQVVVLAQFLLAHKRLAMIGIGGAMLAKWFLPFFTSSKEKSANRELEQLRKENILLRARLHLRESRNRADTPDSMKISHAIRRRTRSQDSILNQ